MRVLFIIVIMAIVSFGCDKKETPIVTSCDFVSKVSDSDLRNAPRDSFDIIETNLENDCLEVTVRYSGGCGGAEFNLFAGEDVTDGIPPQREAVISFKDEDNCEALVTKTISFDLVPLRVDISNEVDLYFEGFREPISYKY